MPFAAGGFFLLMGVFFIVFRRRMGENMAKAGQIPREGNYPTLFMVGLGIFGIVGGAFILVLASLNAQHRRPEATSATSASAPMLLLASFSAWMGTWAVPVVLLLTVAGSLAVPYGVALFRKVWRNRETWSDGDMVSVPPRDARRIQGATMLVLLGSFALVVGIGLLVAPMVTT